MRFHKIVPHIVSAATLAMPMTVLAVAHTTGPALQTPGTPITTLQGFFGLFCIAANVLFTVILVLSVVILLYAAFQFLTGGGDEERTTQARRWLTYAVVGVVIALVAKGLVLVVANSFGGSVQQCT